MVKVKKGSTKSESFSKTSKKSHGAVHSIKSPKNRKLSSKPLKQKKSIDTLLQTNQDSIKIKQKKNKPKIQDANLTEFEDKFNIKLKDVEAAVEGVIQLHLTNPKIKNQLFEDEGFPISLMINCHKIPLGHQKIFRIPLSHTLVTPDDEICLIVSEVKGFGNKEHEKHIEHYENLLSQREVTNIKKIITVHELKTEYETFEQKSRLVDLYDYFLVCGKVSGKVVKKCGKIFYQKRKVPTPVKLQSTKLKEHINKQLSKAYFYLHLKGDCHNVEFGNSKMETSQLVDNFVSVVEFLNKEFPGGFNNIKGLHITATRASSIPVYISTKNSNKIPNARVRNENKFVSKAVRGELTTQLDAEVLVKPSGQVTVIKENQNKRPHNNNDSEVPIKKIKSDKKEPQKSIKVSEEKSKKKGGNGSLEASKKKIKLDKKKPIGIKLEIPEGGDNNSVKVPVLNKKINSKVPKNHSIKVPVKQLKSNKNKPEKSLNEKVPKGGKKYKISENNSLGVPIKTLQSDKKKPQILIIQKTGNKNKSKKENVGNINLIDSKKKLKSDKKTKKSQKIKIET